MVNGAVLTVVDPASATGHEQWLAAHGRTPQREPHSHPNYCKAVAVDEAKIRCAVWQEPSGQVMMPFELRTIQSAQLGTDYSDAVTPYGYGGAFVTGVVDEHAFWSAWHAWCLRENVVGLLVGVRSFWVKPLR